MSTCVWTLRWTAQSMPGAIPSMSPRSCYRRAFKWCPLCEKDIGAGPSHCRFDRDVTAGHGAGDRRCLLKGAFAAVKRDKASAIAAEGITHAIQVFTNGGVNTIWSNALAGNFGAAFGSPDCNSGADVVGADGGHFRLSCQSLLAGAPNNCPASQCQSYQVYVKLRLGSRDPMEPMPPSSPSGRSKLI